MKTKLLRMIGMGVGLMCPAWVWGAALGEVLEPEGMSYTRENGEVLNLRLVENRWYLYFLDAERKVIEPTVPSVLVQVYEANYGPPAAVVPLKPGEGPHLTHPRHFHERKIQRIRVIIPDDNGGAETFPVSIFSGGASGE